MKQRTMESQALAAEKWLSCNGQQLRNLAEAGLFWLDRNHDQVNSMNVFPVPDGDTGTNMVLTMRSAVGRIADSEQMHVGTVAAELSQGALMGARGNSGVILSQIWRGLAKAWKGKEVFDAQDLADALQEASETAYNGVMQPVEGTILTVIREGASEAAEAANRSQDLRFVLERVLERCQQTLERTPDMLPILKQAGVADSGGQGLVFILEGMLQYISGHIQELGHPEISANGDLRARVTAQERAMPAGGQIENPYDVQFLLIGKNLDVKEVRQAIDAMGDSTVVVGDDETIKVHIHVKNPGEPLSYGVALGEITDVVVENMQQQMEEIIHPQQHSAVRPPVELAADQIGVVAIVSGVGLQEVFYSLGVFSIVNGGQTHNPSTEEIFQAIEAVPSEKVIVLPNNKNVILTAKAARDLSSKEVAVVPTLTPPQGIGALLSLASSSNVEETAQAMEEAAAEVSTGEITRATRSVTIDGVVVNKGEIIGLVDGRLSASSPDLSVVLSSMLDDMEMGDREIVSIYYGKEVTHTDAAALGLEIEKLFPHIEVELLSGGQDHYFFILGAE